MSFTLLLPAEFAETAALKSASGLGLWLVEAFSLSRTAQSTSQPPAQFPIRRHFGCKQGNIISYQSNRTVMGNISKIFALFLTLIIAMSCLTLLTVKPVLAQSIPTPSVPQFTIQLADHSYDTPPVTSSTTNPYNNKTTTTTIPSYHIRNITIDLTIVNQPYPKIINGNASFVYYDVRIKPHFGQDWTELYQYYGNSPVQSNSQVTVISLSANYQVGDQIDIQVQAAIGYKIVTLIGHPPMPNVYTESVDFQHTSSDWSPTQTLTIGASSNSPTPTATVPELSWLAIVPLLLSLFAGTVIARYRKKNQLKQLPFS